MRCKRAKKWMSAGLDGELALRGQRKLEEHLAECEGCRREMSRFRSVGKRLDEAVRDLVSKSPGPDRELAGRLDDLQATVKDLATKSDETAGPVWLIPALILSTMVICTVLLITFLGN